MNTIYGSSLILLLLSQPLVRGDQKLEITLETGKRSGTQVICVPINLPEKFKPISSVAIKDDIGKSLTVGQLTKPGLMTQGIKADKDKKRWDLHFILKDLKPNSTVKLSATVSEFVTPRRGPSGFAWKGKFTPEIDLTYDDRLVLRYEFPKLDDATPAKREATYKPFHQVFDPRGKVLVTKGAGGQYTHHRGIYYGFMKCSYDKTTVDIWHCKKDTHQAHQRIKDSEAGVVLGRHLVEIDWNGDGKKTFAKELRELTVYAVPGGTLIEFASLLTPTVKSLKLDGDPQHAGFHFRASNEVAAKTSKETIFIRPDGVGKPGTERNWDGKKNKTHINLPWLAMSFVVAKERYTICYLDKPNNPKEARFSERTYGRIGSYFVTTATKDKPLLVNYRLWLQDGQMKQDDIKTLSDNFIDPVKAKVK